MAQTQTDPTTLQEKVVALGLLKELYKAQHDALASEIKGIMKAREITTLEAGDFTASIVHISGDTVDTAKVIDLCRKHEITLADLAKCIKVNKTPLLTIVAEQSLRKRNILVKSGATSQLRVTPKKGVDLNTAELLSGLVPMVGAALPDEPDDERTW